MMKTNTDMETSIREKVRLLASRAKKFWLGYKKNRAAVGGLIVFLSLIVIAALAPIIAPHHFFEVNPPSKLKPPSLEHLMGTDELGRDLFSGIVYGSRVSLLTGFMCASITTIIGLLVGSIAGYYGGRIDDVLMRFTEIVLVIPSFFLVLLIVAFFGSNVWNTIAVIGFVIWPSTARLARAQFLTFKERTFVEAARAGGAGDARIMFRHIMPNALPPIIVTMSFRAATAILWEAGLSFLGLGDPNTVSWGMLLRRATAFLRLSWWYVIFPGLFIFITVLSFNLVGDGLNDVLNPKLKER